MRFSGVNKEEKKLPALGKAGVDELLCNLSSFPIKGFSQATGWMLEQIASNGFTPGYGIGISAIDELFTLKKKHLTVVTGLPSVGKSVWVRFFYHWYRTNDRYTSPIRFTHTW